jgi:hypothetical protein
LCGGVDDLTGTVAWGSWAEATIDNASRKSDTSGDLIAGSYAPRNEFAQSDSGEEKI